MPHTSVFCDWSDPGYCDCAATALRSVVEGFPILTNGELLFLTEIDMVVRVRRVHRVPAHTRLPHRNDARPCARNCPGHPWSLPRAS